MGLKHEGQLWEGNFHLEYDIFMQVELVWSVSKVELWIDRVLAVNLTSASTPLGGIDEVTEYTDLVFGRRNDGLDEFAMISIDEVLVWGEITVPDPYISEGNTN